jgi:hypothetical protein
MCGDMEAWDVKAWEYMEIEARCGRVDVEEWKSGGLEVWRRTAGAAVWKYRGMERAGALEASCRYGDMEYGDMEQQV